MYFLLVLCIAVAGVMASDECTCTMGDRQQVLHDWQSVWSGVNQGRRATISKAMFSKMFAMNEETKALFKHVNVDDMDSPQFTAHCIRVANGLDTAITLSLKSDVLEEQQSHLGRKHAGIEGMKSEYFDLFRVASADVLSKAVPCFNRSAWDRCMRYRQGIMSRVMSK